MKTNKHYRKAEKPRQKLDHQPTDEEIAKLAYRFWEQRGRADGRDFDDWMDAEQELIAASLRELPPE